MIYVRVGKPSEKIYSFRESCFRRDLRTEENFLNVEDLEPKHVK